MLLAFLAQHQLNDLFSAIFACNFLWARSLKKAESVEWRLKALPGTPIRCRFAEERQWKDSERHALTAGAADMGGLQFFCTSVDQPEAFQDTNAWLYNITILFDFDVRCAVDVLQFRGKREIWSSWSSAWKQWMPRVILVKRRWPCRYKHTHGKNLYQSYMTIATKITIAIIIRINIKW